MFTELPTLKHFYISLPSLVESVAKSQSTNLPLKSESLILKLILKEKALFSHEQSCSHKLDNLDKSLGFGKVWRTLCSPGPLNKLNQTELFNLVTFAQIVPQAQWESGSLTCRWKGSVLWAQSQATLVGVVVRTVSEAWTGSRKHFSWKDMSADRKVIMKVYNWNRWGKA